MTVQLMAGKSPACLGRLIQACNRLKTVMPMWLAELTVTLFDGISPDNVVSIALRYGALIGRWGAVSEAGWRRILTKTLVYLIDQAVDAARPVAETEACWSAVFDACGKVKVALVGGDEADLAAAEAAARAAMCHRIFSFVLDQIEAELSAA